MAGAHVAGQPHRAEEGLQQQDPLIGALEQPVQGLEAQPLQPLHRAAAAFALEGQLQASGGGLQLVSQITDAQGLVEPGGHPGLCLRHDHCAEMGDS